MTASPNQNNNQTGLVATFVVGKGWESAKRGLPIPAALEGRLEYPGQIPAKDVVKPFHVAHPFAVKLADENWWDMGAPLPKHNALLDEQPSANKSQRHPLAQAWRNAGKPQAPEIEPTNNGLLLESGQAVLLLASGIVEELTPESNTLEQLALEAVGTMAGYPVGQFMGEYGVPVLNSLLNQNLVVVKKDHVYVFAPAPTQPLAVSAQPAPAQPAKPKAKPADIFAQAQEHKRLMKNNLEAYKLAREIYENKSAADSFLLGLSIHSGTPVSDELLAQVQAVVTQEKLQYVTATTRAMLDIYGAVIHGEITWTGCKSSGANKYSKGRTRFFDRVYEEQALAWLEELKRKSLSPVQILELGKRMDAARQSNLRVSNAGSGSRRIH